MIALVGATGGRQVLPVERWAHGATTTERALLARAPAPVLDAGCGPGRLVVALAEQGVAALGVDASPAAVARARARGAPVLERSVFAPLPGEGRWGTVVLLDGNIGIGGDSVRLLRRCRALLAPVGRVLVEVEPAGSPTHRGRARLVGDGATAWFPWAWVAVDGLEPLAEAAGFSVEQVEWLDRRWFAWLAPQR